MVARCFPFDSQSGNLAGDEVMNVRFLVSGLAVLIGLVILAAMPVVAQGHTPNPKQPCTITGTKNADYLVGTSGPDVICGYGGNDTIAGSGGNDILKGGGGADDLLGDGGTDALYGGGGRDYLWIRDNSHDHGYGGRGYDRARRDPFKDTLGGVEYHN
jgi:Ca2+-binding RTX toxin-like protein